MACGGYQTTVQCPYKSLADYLNTTENMSTALHPQSDSQNEHITALPSLIVPWLSVIDGLSPLEVGGRGGGVVLGARSSHWGERKAA